MYSEKQSSNPNVRQSGIKKKASKETDTLYCGAEYYTYNVDKIATNIQATNSNLKTETIGSRKTE